MVKYIKSSSNADYIPYFTDEEIDDIIWTVSNNLTHKYRPYGADIEPVWGYEDYDSNIEKYRLVGFFTVKSHFDAEVRDTEIGRNLDGLNGEELIGVAVYYPSTYDTKAEMKHYASIDLTDDVENLIDYNENYFTEHRAELGI
jgi:hypothetical protein